MKKLLVLLSVSVMSIVLAGCNLFEDDNKLVIWSFTDELEEEGDIQYFKDNFTGEGQKYEGMEVELVIVPTEDYLTTILPVLRSGSGAPDVFTGELDMLYNYMEGDFLADLESLMQDDEDLDFEATKADFVDYIWESGIDSADGQLKALSWQITPGAIFFKTDMAEAVWGDEDGFPGEDVEGNYNQAVSDWVSAHKFDSLENLVTSSEEVKAYNNNWRLFPNDDAIRFFAQDSDTPDNWVAQDGMINPERLQTEETYMDTVSAMYGSSIADSLTANIGEWSGEWYGGMGKEFETADGEVYQTMAYSLPTWGLFHVLEPSIETDENDEPLGNWGMASGPNSYFWGGTYLNIYKDSDNMDAAYDFVKTMLFDTDRMMERAANGDVYARHSIMDEITEDYAGNPTLGGMNHYDFFLEEAQNINFDNISKYDTQLDVLFGSIVDDYKRGDFDSKADAFNTFYNDLQSTYPELYRESGLPYQD